ncbi:MAG: hypothetical protein ACPLQP_02895 [Moorellaceae bacterium]
MALYEVRDLAGRKLVIEANSSTQAKSLACKKWGRKASDYWCGITSLRAKKLKED